jgi:hypothetical protein
MNRWKTGNGIKGMHDGKAESQLVEQVMMDRWKTGNGIESMHDGKAERQAVDKVM